jgi:DNA-binding transcriptional ArsR family regulator
MEAAMQTTKREEAFSVDRKGLLVRSVTPRRGTPYEHRCRLESLNAVAHRFDEHGQGDTVETIAEALDASITQVATALAFLLERGIVTVEHRCNYPATIDVYLDAMTEYHALREQPV